MGKGKLWKWEENAEMDNVFEPDLQDAVQGANYPYKGQWHKAVFKNDNPITLELGCGKGEYTVGLARKWPNRNFIGVDIKGHRFWRGAKTANEESLSNVAFLRTRIEFIDQFFGPGEVADIWLTFSDPQPKDEKGTKRITSGKFIERYRRFLAPEGTVKVKSDSALLYALSKEDYVAAGYPFLHDSDDVYGGFLDGVDDDLREALEIKTYYEQRWLAEGKNIHFMEIRPPAWEESPSDA